MLRSALHAGLAGVFGAAMGASLAPADAWWFAPFCLAGLFALLPGAGHAQRFAFGLLFGLGWFGAGLWWVIPGIAASTGAGWPLAGLLGTSLLVYLALFPAAAAVAGGVLSQGRPGWLYAAALAATWTLCDWARGHLFTGMPMLPAGLPHVGGPLAGFAPVAGVHGVGFAGALCAALLARYGCAGAGKWRTADSLVPLLAVLSILAAGHWLRGEAWTAPAGVAVTARLIQTDVAQEDKFDARAEARIQRGYALVAANSPADLTAFPETALSVGWESMPAPWRQAWTSAAAGRVVLIGAPRAVKPVQGLIGDASNSMLGIGGNQLQRYDKVHLVPLGELLPEHLAWLGRLMAVPLGALVPGAASQTPLRVRGTRIGVAICYENQFEDYLALQSRSAGVLLVASNLAWARGFADAQHLQASRMRALETGRWLMQVSNGDGTALVDPAGAIAASLEKGPGILDVGVPAMTGTTPFARHGSAPVLALCALLVAAALAAPRLHRALAAPRLHRALAAPRVHSLPWRWSAGVRH